MTTGSRGFLSHIPERRSEKAWIRRSGWEYSPRSDWYILCLGRLTPKLVALGLTLYGLVCIHTENITAGIAFIQDKIELLEVKIDQIQSSLNCRDDK
jgi:hypothetical protein